MQQLVTTADPTGISEVIMFLIDLYRTIKTAVQYMRPILIMMNRMLDSIIGIATCVLQGAADLIKEAMDKGMPVVIGFLANLVELGYVDEPRAHPEATVRTDGDGWPRNLRMRE